MTTLKEINAYYHTDWKRGDIVELLPQDGGKGRQYRLTGRCFVGHMYVYAQQLDASHRPLGRTFFHPKSIQRVKE